MRVATGLERLANDDADVVRLVRGRRVGLVAHPASVDSKLRHARVVLQEAGADVRALFGPEHGFLGQAQDMIGVGDAVPCEQLPTYSLYGSSFEELSPKREWLEGLDAIVIDLQDVGSRYYTFVWTAALVLRSAAALGIECIVLDRPNPLGGEVIEGAPQRPGYRSFVGLCDVSVRHGMTIGEICNMVRALEGIDAKLLRVVTMAGWQRSMLFPETRLPWVLPSPNMPTFDTVLVYPGGCLIEGTNLSEGRGTTRPFEIWGAPFVDGQRLARELASDGAVLRALSFEPTFHKHARTLCGGVQVHVEDATTFRSYALYLRMLAKVAAWSEGQFRFRTEPYEFVSDRPAIDLLTGGPEYRTSVERGDELDAVLAAETTGAQRFSAERAPFLLYG